MTMTTDTYCILWREPHTHPQHVRTYTTEDNQPVASRLEQIDPPLPITHVIDDEAAYDDWSAVNSGETVAVRTDVVQARLGWNPVTVVS